MLAVLVIVGFIMAPGFYRKTDDAPHSNPVGHQVLRTPQPDKQFSEKVVVSYIYRGVRCASCVRLEQLTREAVAEQFATEIQRGVVEFNIVNAGKKENAHVIQAYGLYTQAVIVSDVIRGEEQRWKLLPKVWELLYNENAFKTYVQTEVAAYLKEKQL